MPHHWDNQKLHAVNLVQTDEAFFSWLWREPWLCLESDFKSIYYKRDVWRVTLKGLHLYLLKRLVCLLLTFWFKKIIFGPRVSISVFLLWNIMENNCLVKAFSFTLLCVIRPSSRARGHLQAQHLALILALVSLLLHTGKMINVPWKSPNDSILFLSSL